METHRVLHDFGELKPEDVIPAEPGFISKKPYHSLFAALLVGLIAGYLMKRK
jgi:ElaB/YqjD/DUF883 family membrane-anchored ribosome-binding protein